jgi:hypothetical protein
MSTVEFNNMIGGYFPACGLVRTASWAKFEFAAIHRHISFVVNSPFQTR